MDIFRKMRRLNPTVHTIETVKNMVDEKSVTKGLKRTFHEDICEDSIIGAACYNEGKKDGYREGYEEASRIYETKLRSQSEEFFKKAEIAKSQINEYKKLLREYEECIEMLEAENERTKKENDLLRKLLNNKARLEQIKVA